MEESRRPCGPGQRGRHFFLSSGHQLFPCKDKRNKKRQEVGAQKPGAGEWATPKSPPGALLWKKEMATCVPSQGALWLRGQAGQTGTRPRKKSPPTVVSWNCAVRAKQNLGSEVVMWEVDPKGVPRRVTRLWHSLSGAPAVATGSHCFATGPPSRPMITLGDPSVLSNTYAWAAGPLAPGLGAGPGM